MKCSRSLMLPLFAAIALSPLPGGVANAKSNNSSASFGYLNALLGSNKTDLYMDGKSIFRNIKEGRAKKPKRLNSEGYSVQVNAAKVGFNYLDLNLTLIAGHDYTLIPMGNLETGTAQALLVDIPSLVVPQYASHVVFASASPDAPPVDIIIDGRLIVRDVPSGVYVGPGAFPAGKHSIEIQVDGNTIWSSNKVNLRKKKTTTLVLTGTVAPDDHFPIKVESIVTKGL